METKPPIEGLPRVHVFLRKIRAFIKHVPIHGEEWEENQKCALHDIESLIAMMTPVLDESLDPCRNQRIRIYVEKEPVIMEEFQPKLEK